MGNDEGKNTVSIAVTIECSIMRLPFTILFFFVLLTGISAEKSGYRIEITPEGFSEEYLILASYYGKNNQVIDTVEVAEDGNFIFQGKEALSGGVYLVIFPPENKFFELVIDREQHFSVQVDVSDPVNTIKLKGSEENKMFYDYLRYVAGKRKEMEALMEQEKTANEKEKEGIKLQREIIDKDVKAYFDNIIEKYPDNINSMIIKANRPMDMPDHLNKPGADQTERYLYYKSRYFDAYDFSDDRLLRTNFFYKRVDYYLEKLTPQLPDSIILSVDKVLMPMNKDGDMFKYYLVYLLNKYAKSKIVGMDAVYVHIVKTYYAKGLAPWTDEETLEKIIKNAEALEPILIGKKAPNILLQQKDGTPVSLHEIPSKYIVLYFWDPDCGHCKKSSPDMIAFHEAFKDKGVKVVAVCTEVRDEVKKCWETIEERGYEWMNLVDPFLRSRYKTKYDIKSTPQIFILDEERKIRIKRIGADQLEKVMEQIILQDEK